MRTHAGCPITWPDQARSLPSCASNGSARFWQMGETTALPSWLFPRHVLCRGMTSVVPKKSARSAFLGSVAPHARHRQAVATEPLAFSHAGIVDRARFEAGCPSNSPVLADVGDRPTPPDAFPARTVSGHDFSRAEKKTARSAFLAAAAHSLGRDSVLQSSTSSARLRSSHKTRAVS